MENGERRLTSSQTQMKSAVVQGDTEGLVLLLCYVVMYCGRSKALSSSLFLALSTTLGLIKASRQPFG